MAAQNLIDHLRHTRVDTVIKHGNQTLTINEKKAHERQLLLSLSINQQV